MKGFVDYIVGWAGNGATGGQPIAAGFPPRTIQVVGTDPSGVTGLLFTLVAGGRTLELPAGDVTDALLVAASGGGFVANGKANQAGWTYRAMLTA